MTEHVTDHRQPHSCVAVRELVADLREQRTGMRWGSAPDLTLAPAFDDDRVWELIAARVGDTVSPPLLGSLTRFLG